MKLPFTNFFLDFSVFFMGVPALWDPGGNLLASGAVQVGGRLPPRETPRYPGPAGHDVAPVAARPGRHRGDGDGVYFGAVANSRFELVSRIFRPLCTAVLRMGRSRNSLFATAPFNDTQRSLLHAVTLPGVGH